MNQLISESINIDDKESCEYRFTSIYIDSYRFSLIIIVFLYFYFNSSEKHNGQEICFVHNESKQIQRNVV